MKCNDVENTGKWEDTAWSGYWDGVEKTEKLWQCIVNSPCLRVSAGGGGSCRNPDLTISPSAVHPLTLPLNLYYHLTRIFKVILATVMPHPATLPSPSACISPYSPPQRTLWSPSPAHLSLAPAPWRNPEVLHLRVLGRWSEKTLHWTCSGLLFSWIGQTVEKYLSTSGKCRVLMKLRKGKTATRVHAIYPVFLQILSFKTIEQPTFCKL